LYVRVLNARGETCNCTEEAKYWLKHVKAFGDNAPVTIVGNKTDLASVTLDMGLVRLGKVVNSSG